MSISPADWRRGVSVLLLILVLVNHLFPVA